MQSRQHLRWLPKKIVHLASYQYVSGAVVAVGAGLCCHHGRYLPCPRVSHKA